MVELRKGMFIPFLFFYMHRKGALHYYLIWFYFQVSLNYLALLPYNFYLIYLAGFDFFYQLADV